jgi:ribosomal protein S4
MWMWNGWDQLVEVEAPNRIDKVLVAAGMASSVSEATRLVKGGGVTVDRERVNNPRFALPAGKIVLVRVGKSSWRLVPREGRPGWDGFPTWRDVMIPVEGQEFEFWKSL